MERREGFFAAVFAAFFLTFGLPSAVIPLASDMLLILPHLARDLFRVARPRVLERRGCWHRIAVQFESDLRSGRMRALAVASSADAARWIRCAERDRARLDVAARLGRPNITGRSGSGDRSTPSNTFVDNPLAEGLKRTADWIGFQAALVDRRDRRACARSQMATRGLDRARRSPASSSACDSSHATISCCCRR